MKITKRDLLKLYNVISLIENRQFTVKFSYFIAKNKVTMRDEIIALDKARKVSEKFKLYENERVDLAKKFSDKNIDGSSKIQDNSFVITKQLNLFQGELSKIREKYADAISEREKQLEEFEKLLDETIEYTGTKIEFKYMPESIESSTLEIFILVDLIIDEN